MTGINSHLPKGTYDTTRGERRIMLDITDAKSQTQIRNAAVSANVTVTNNILASNQLQAVCYRVRLVATADTPSPDFTYTVAFEYSDLDDGNFTIPLTIPATAINIIRPSAINQNSYVTSQDIGAYGLERAGEVIGSVFDGTPLTNIETGDCVNCVVFTPRLAVDKPNASGVLVYPIKNYRLKLTISDYVAGGVDIIVDRFDNLVAAQPGLYNGYVRT